MTNCIRVICITKVIDNQRGTAEIVIPGVSMCGDDRLQPGIACSLVAIGCVLDGDALIGD